MKRTLLIALGALLVLVLAAGCANTPDASESPSQSASASAEDSESAAPAEASEDTNAGTGLDKTEKLEGLSYKVNSAWESEESTLETSGEDVKSVIYTESGKPEDGLIVSAIQIEPELWEQINAVSLQPGEDAYEAVISTWEAAFGKDSTEALDPLPSGVHGGWQAKVTADGMTTRGVILIGEDGLEYTATITDTDAEENAFSAVWDEFVKSLSVA